MLRPSCFPIPHARPPHSARVAGAALRARLAVAGTLAVLALAAPAAWAGLPGFPADAETAIRQLAERSVSAGTQGTVEVRIGQLDSRLQLVPCARAEYFVPAGTRLWGRGVIAARCTQGAAWTVSVPVEVVVRGPALVATTSLPMGAAPGPADLRVEQIELTREPAPLVQDPAQVAGRVLSRPVTVGQPLRQDHLKIAQTVAAGDPVRILVAGDGFSIASDGVALAAGGEGQPLKVRTENGRVLSGVLRDRTVEVRL